MMKINLCHPTYCLQELFLCVAFPPYLMFLYLPNPFKLLNFWVSSKLRNIPQWSILPCLHTRTGYYKASALHYEWDYKTDMLFCRYIFIQWLKKESIERISCHLFIWARSQKEHRDMSIWLLNRSDLRWHIKGCKQKSLISCRRNYTK
jgi:hypothetical protein